MSDLTDDVGGAEGLGDPSTAGPHGPAADPATVAAIEDARAVAGSLLGPWKRDRRELWELQRPWPSLDPALPRGALRHPTRPISELPPPEDPADGPPKKRPRPDAPAAADGGAEEAAVMEDGSLELPVIPCVPPEVMEAVIESRGRCGTCPVCRAPPRRGASAACPARKAAQRWKEALGGVTYAAVREVASRIEVPRSDITYKGRVGHGVRCGLCPACKGKASRACALPAAIAADALPLRLRAAAAEGVAAAAARREAPQGGRITLQDYIRAMPGHAGPGLDPTGPVAGALRGGGGDDGTSDDEDALRWAAWGGYLARPPSAAQQGRGERLDQRGQRSRGGSKGGEKVTAEAAARRLGAGPESLEEWVCRARVRSAEQPTPQRNARRQSTAATTPTELQPALEDCGHLNSKGAFSCAACGAARWDGPLGQLRARVAAALAGGLLAGAAGLPAAEQDAALAAAVAARMAAEAGTAADALPDFQGAEDRQAGGRGGGADPAGALGEVYAAVQEVRMAMETAAEADGPAREAGRRSGSALAAAAAAARDTQLAGAVAELEGAVCRLVEEQEGLAAVQRRRLGLQDEGAGPGSAAAATEAEPDPLRALRSLRALLAGDRPLLAARPGSAAESEEGAGNGGADAAETVGYSAFCARVSAYLSGDGGIYFSGSQEDAAEGRHRATCELLFCCPPPPPAQGWTEAALAQLEAVLSDAQAMDVLVAASHAGGTPVVSRALHALLRLAERSSAAAAAAEAGEFPAGGGSQTQASQQLLLLPTQQSQPDPGPPAPGGEAPAPAPAEPLPADADVTQSLAALDDLIGAYEARGLQGSAPSGDPDGGGARTRRLAHASASTLSFLYGLAHAVLDAVALRQAEALVPLHLSSAKATILEHARFPEFPPLPAPAFLEPPGAAASPAAPAAPDPRDVWWPVPDSRRPAQAMAPGVAPPIGRGGAHPPPPPRSELGPRPGGLFVAWNAGEMASEAAPEPSAIGDAMAEAEAAAAACPSDAQLVFSEALKRGMRPEAVAAAVRRYVAITAAGEGES